MVAEREENGPFLSMTDFCRRMGEKDLNKRALESLIKAGAFDSLGGGFGKRSAFLQAYPGIMSAAVAGYVLVTALLWAVFRKRGKSHQAQNRGEDGCKQFLHEITSLSAQSAFYTSIIHAEGRSSREFAQINDIPSN